MTSRENATEAWLDRYKDETFAYLTTIGRASGKPHRIEIWFGVHEAKLYLMSGGRDRSDWVKNIRNNPEVSIELADETRTGKARIIKPATDEDELARFLLVEKYRDGDNLNEWGRNSLPIVIEFA